MKNILFLFFLLLVAGASAQQNAVKLGLMSAGYGDYSLSYERELTHNSSIIANGGYWNIDISLVDLYNYFDAGRGVWLQDIGAGWHSSLEYRFYVGKADAIQGFYIGPYLRYWQHKLLLADFINNDQVQNKTFDVESKFFGFGLGAQLGYQWVIKDRVTIDFYFLGLGVENLHLNADYVIRGGSSFNYNLIESDVRDVFSSAPDFIENKVNINPAQDALHIKLPTWLPGIRSGLTVGYAF